MNRSRHDELNHIIEKSIDRHQLVWIGMTMRNAILSEI